MADYERLTRAMVGQKPYSMSDYLQGRRNPLMDDDQAMWWSTPPNALAGHAIPEQARPMTHGKGSVQPISPPALGQHNLLDRALRSFGQPMYDATVAGIEDVRRTGQLPAQDWRSALEFAGMVPMGPIGGTRIPNPIRSYHGSPYQFDEFDLRHFGTGEARIQDVPYGVNLGAEPLARFYRDTISRRHGVRGHIYETAIHADPNQIVNLHASVGRQSPQVREALAGLGYDVSDRLTPAKNRYVAAYQTWRANPTDATDAELRAALEALHDARREGVARTVPMRTERDVAPLIEAGIPGARLGTDQYVIWQPELLEILRRYGIAAPVAGGAAASSLMGDQPQY